MANHLFITTSLNYLTLGEGKCVPQMQSTIHVWEREGTEELFIRTSPGFKWSIHFIYLSFFPSSLNILLNLLKVFNLESTLSIKGRGLEIKTIVQSTLLLQTIPEQTQHCIMTSIIQIFKFSMSIGM